MEDMKTADAAAGKFSEKHACLGAQCERIYVRVKQGSARDFPDGQMVHGHNSRSVHFQSEKMRMRVNAYIHISRLYGKAVHHTCIYPSGGLLNGTTTKQAKKYVRR